MLKETEKYKQAWKKFQDKMQSLRKRKSEILSSISKKLDQQKIESLMREIKGHE